MTDEKNWHTQMVEYLRLKGAALSTIQSYTTVTGNFLNSLPQPWTLKEITEEHYRNYFLDMIANGCSKAVVKSAFHGTRVLFNHILGHNWSTFDLLKSMKNDRKIPTILAKSEVHQIIGAFRKFRYQVFFYPLQLWVTSFRGCKSQGF